MEVANAADEQIRRDKIADAPKSIDGRGGKSLAGRACERTLERLAHASADEMRNGVGQKCSAEEAGAQINPRHVIHILFTFEVTGAADFRNG